MTIMFDYVICNNQGIYLKEANFCLRADGLLRADKFISIEEYGNDYGINFCC